MKETGLYPKGVQVLTIKPGFVDTPMTAGLKKGPLFCPRRARWPATSSARWKAGPVFSIPVVLALDHAYHPADSRAGVSQIERL